MNLTTVKNTPALFACGSRRIRLSEPYIRGSTYQTLSPKYDMYFNPLLSYDIQSLDSSMSKIRFGLHRFWYITTGIRISVMHFHEHKLSTCNMHNMCTYLHVCCYNNKHKMSIMQPYCAPIKHQTRSRSTGHIYDVQCQIIGQHTTFDLINMTTVTYTIRYCSTLWWVYLQLAL